MSLLAHTKRPSLSWTDQALMKGRTRIVIDPVACDAYGYCAEILPEAIGLDEWGYPITKDGSLPPELLALAKRAARDCPKRALTIRESRSA